MFLRLSRSLWMQTKNRFHVCFLLQYYALTVYFTVSFLENFVPINSSISSSANKCYQKCQPSSPCSQAKILMCYTLYTQSQRWLLRLKSACARQCCVNGSIRNHMFSRLIRTGLNIWRILQAHLLYTFKN